jgi:hypothetical protein
MEDPEKENCILKELPGNNQIFAIESLENSHILQNDINDLKKNLKEKISTNEFYLENYEQIHKLQNFFKARYMKKRINEGKPKNQLQRIKEENINLKKENSKLKAANKALILEMFLFVFNKAFIIYL